MIATLLSVILLLPLCASQDCFEYKQSSSVGIIAGKECGNLKPSDCCGRCQARNHTTGCVSVDWGTDGCCTYYKTFTGTKSNGSSSALTVAWPIPPTPGPVKGSYCDQPGWNIIWQDEFNGESLDTDNWAYMIGHDEGTLRQATGTKDNVYVKDGNLVLRANLDGYDPDRPKNCSGLLKQTDYTGGVGVGTTSAPDVGTCCMQCQQNPVCQYFVYYPGAWGCDVGCCYQKSGGVVAKSNINTTAGFCPGGGTYTSGAVISGGNNPAKVGTAENSWEYGRFCVRAKLPGVPMSGTRPSNCSTLMPNTDVLGGDVGFQSAKDVGQCCDQCYHNPLCSYFVYLKGAWGCDIGCCYMKSEDAVGFNTSATGCQAGYSPGGSVKNQGIWPAHWMMPDVADCWPTKGEIDIMEMINGDNEVHGTYHWSGDGACDHDAASGGFTQSADWGQYHEYAVEWNRTHMFFLLDGSIYHQVHPGDPPTYGGPNKATFFTEKYYWLLNTAIGDWGSWAGPPSINTVFPAYHYIDYVRVAKST